MRQASRLTIVSRNNKMTVLNATIIRKLNAVKANVCALSLTKVSSVKTVMGKRSKLWTREKTQFAASTIADAHQTCVTVMASAQSKTIKHSASVTPSMRVCIAMLVKTGLKCTLIVT